MDSRIFTFVSAAAILVGVRLAMLAAERRHRPFFEVSSSALPAWNAGQLVLASFLTLFAELALIRWIAVEVRIFAYFKNLALLLCFVGFGLGCALAKQKVRWPSALKAFLGLLLIIRLPTPGSPLEQLSQGLGGARDVQIWSVSSWNWVHFVVAATLAGTLFLLIVFVFVPLGQTVSQQMNAASSPLRAYSWNLIGSLAGVLFFFLISRLMLQPPLWLGAALLGFALLQKERRDRLLVAGLIVPLVLLLHAGAGPETQILWTPYQQIRYTREHLPTGEILGGSVLVNHTFYQKIVNLSPEFLRAHPDLLGEAPEDDPYNIPFRFAATSPQVMIVGAGTGNDVAAALRHQSRSVDAVEIDPAILDLGKREHPEHPYDSPRVSTHVTDARAFLKRSNERYDLILFGLLDSHSQFTDYANMRIDNFVYTEESFREAKQHLVSDGVMFVKFWVAAEHAWLAVRLEEMLTRTFGKPPLVFFTNTNYSTSATCFVISTGNRVADALAADPSLAQFVSANALRLPQKPVPITTDDWPYLYQEGRWIPRTYYSVAVLVILVALGLYMQIGEANRRPPSLFFFSMGAGFLLLETQVISRLALFFGTIWQVNGIVISALLVALLLANLFVEYRRKPPNALWTWIALIAGLVVAYGFPFERIGGSPAMVGTIAVVIFSVPVVFAGILFSLEFRSAESPSAALGANVLGAVAGGLLENLSLLFGMRALLLLAIAVYCLAGIALWRRRERRTSPSPADIPSRASLVSRHP